MKSLFFAFFAAGAQAAAPSALSTPTSLAAPASNQTKPAACAEWASPKSIGKLESAFLPEASGLAVSARFERLYHNNDSGDGGNVYASSMDGSGTKKIELENFKPADAEDLAVGPCGSGTSCVYLADIGDNREKRKTVQVAVFEEPAQVPNKLKPLRVLQLKYPDRAHNAEALAIHPNGDLFVITKEMKSSEARTAQVFRLKKSEVERNGKDVRTFEAWGKIDVPTIVGSKGYEGLVTGMSIAPSGDRFLLLTYEKVLEINWDLGREALPAQVPLTTSGQVSVIPVRRLYQQEAISYHKNGRDFLYDTEMPGTLATGPRQAELISMTCKKRNP